jgi:hypothetical protein
MTSNTTILLAAVIGVIGVVLAALIQRVWRRTNEIHVLVNDRMTKALAQIDRLQNQLDAALGILENGNHRDD